jgi:hypothetical protein
MNVLTANTWLKMHSPDSGGLVTGFYVPALECAVRYDRSTGYFSADALALAARGIEGLVRNRGRMRLVVGCTPSAEHVAAIQKGADLCDTVEAALLEDPLGTEDSAAVDALGLRAWTVAKDHLDAKVAVPCEPGPWPETAVGPPPRRGAGAGAVAARGLNPKPRDLGAGRQRWSPGPLGLAYIQ